MTDGFLITPSLYSAWRYWADSEDAGKEAIMDALNKVQKERTPAMRAGIGFENAVRFVCGGGASEDFCVLEAAERVTGGMWQQRVSRELGGDLVYGIADVIRRNTIFDIKLAFKYETGKYEGSIQHLIYMYATGIPNFEYVVSDGREVYAESYRWGEKSLETLRGRISEMKASLLSDDEMRRAFQTHWTYGKDACAGREIILRQNA
ncbi:MAG: hypothetical protein LBH73_00010 [Spirochaetaceae bacterium]|jgi:hypothetical protein|nr:hypothetical protein [Spirochaetaceae bacterium]